jgi:hypothetical protein
MAPRNLNSDQDISELWFAKFFIGSMISIALLTILLSFLPSPSGLRNQPPNKVSTIPTNLLQEMTLQVS